ncbi:MAG: M14 family metallopeptidase [Holophaga sp.]|nr:M14 family metallopeptidase [Holophaga sp.]
MKTFHRWAQPLLLASLGLVAAETPLAFDRYHTPQEIQAAMKTLAAAHPGRTALHLIAKSPGGGEITVLEIGPDIGRKARQAPAVLVVANLEGVLPLTSEGALFLAQAILKDPSKSQHLTWYILPTTNPDAAWRYFRQPLGSSERNAQPWNEDMDDRVDEDGPEDLDGNGVITGMRVKDPAGEWIVAEGDKRLLRKANPVKGEKGMFKLYPEALDKDSDGQYGEDPAGGVNPAINFPHLWKPFTATGGRWAGSTPETFGILQFVAAHPEIAMSFSFDATNLCLQPPAGGRQGTFDPNAIRIPEDTAKRFGADPTRTYSMKEIMDMARPMAPPGMEMTEAMVASFLGLGAIVNPLEADLKHYKELSDKFKEFLKASKLDGKRLEPAQPKDGSFSLWSYYHLGIPTFSMDLWTLPEVKDEKEKSRITAEGLEAMTSETFLALGEPKITAFLKEVGAPETIKASFLMEGVKAGRMNPKQMAGMLKSLPKPPAQEPLTVDPRAKALLAWSDKELQAKGFAEWKAFKHPQLGEVEIGGAMPYADTTPPPAMIKPLLEGQVPWVFTLAAKLPRLKILKSEVKAKGSGVYALDLWVENTGYLPVPTAMGRKNLPVPPAILLLGGKGVEFLQGRSRTPINAVEGGSSVKLQWLVRVSPGSNLDAKLESPTAWGDAATINFAMGESK